MPIIKSAIKRVKTAEKRRRRNLVTKNRWKSVEKEYNKLCEAGEKKKAEALHPMYQKVIDMAAKKNLIHENRAARIKSAAAKKLAAMA